MATSDVVWNKFHASHWNSFLPFFLLSNGSHETYFKWRRRMSFEISFMPPIGTLSFLFFCYPMGVMKLISNDMLWRHTFHCNQALTQCMAKILWIYEVSYVEEIFSYISEENSINRLWCQSKVLNSEFVWHPNVKISAKPLRTETTRNHKINNVLYKRSTKDAFKWFLVPKLDFVRRYGILGFVELRKLISVK